MEIGAIRFTGYNKREKNILGEMVKYLDYE